MFRPYDNNLTRGTRHFMLGEGFQNSYQNVGHLSLAQRIERSEGFQNATDTSKSIFSGNETISIRGPGQNSFLTVDNQVNDAKIINKNFVNTPAFRVSATMEKVYPICGTAGYFSIVLKNNPALHLVAKSSEKNGVVFSEVSTLVDIQDSACWTFNTTNADEIGSGTLMNKSYPGLVLTVQDDNTIMLQTLSASVDKRRNYLVIERGLSTYDAAPMPRRAKFSDFEIRKGVGLMDLNRRFGPIEFRSTELEPTSARSVEECAEKALAYPEANGFVFLGDRSERGKNCRIKAGAFWSRYTTIDPTLAHSISGRLKGDVGVMYQDPIDSFETKRGRNVADKNISYGPNPSYELAPIFTRNAEACAAAALHNTKADSFVFVPREKKNCRLKVGGFWEPGPENPMHSSLISGILKSKLVNKNN